MTSEYFSPPYETSNAVQQFHAVPRFGHSDDITNVLEDVDDRTDYILGVIFLAVVIMSSFVLWSLSILFFKVCNLDCLSGDKLDYKSSPYVRSFFIGCTVMLICSAILFPTKGSESVSNIFDTVRAAALVRNHENQMIRRIDTECMVNSFFLFLFVQFVHT